jgi:hypothetical protein
MKTIKCFSILAAISVGLVMTSWESATCKDARLIFEGKVLEIGPSPGYGSGGVQAYQLVKYRINDICEGTYEGEEIIVDHLLLDPDELKDLRVGDRVCVGVTKVKKTSSRRNDGKLRHDTDKVDAYYVALDIFIRNCQCTRPQ